MFFATLVEDFSEDEIDFQLIERNERSRRGKKGKKELLLLSR
jgi:hypothetical protein